MSITLIIAFIIIFLLIKWLKPDFLEFKKTIQQNPEGLLDADDKYNISKVEKEKELNRLLEKINKKGLQNLSAAEKKRLKELSQ